jgi:uncharacterized membrane protein HdeD (DUF308 family)
LINPHAAEASNAGAEPGQGWPGKAPGAAGRVIKGGARPDLGAVPLALLFGLFSMVYGVSEIVVGVQLRRTGQTLQAVLHDAA